MFQNIIWFVANKRIKKRPPHNIWGNLWNPNKDCAISAKENIGWVDVLIIQRQTLKFQKIAFNTLEYSDIGDTDLVVVSLRGKNGKEAHCVTFFGKLIFDSKNALVDKLSWL